MNRPLDTNALKQLDISIYCMYVYELSNSPLN